jgi:hypothetical protein
MKKMYFCSSFQSVIKKINTKWTQQVKRNTPFGEALPLDDPPEKGAPDFLNYRPVTLHAGTS